MNFRAILKTSFLIRSLLIISISLLIFLSSSSYKHTNALIGSTELLVHSYKIQVKLGQLLAYVEDAETAQRGFLLSRDSVFLRPYHIARSKKDDISQELRSLTSDNVQQYNNLDTLSTLINSRFALLELNLRESDKAQRDLNLLKGKAVMDQMRKRIDKMVDLEILYFDTHQAKYAHELHFTPRSTLILMLFSLMVFGLSFVKINNDLITLKRTNADLRLTTEAFNHAEEIGRFSSWQWHTETGEFIFSDNQYKLLGVKPHSFEPTLDNFMKFVHPDDRHSIEESIRLAVDENKPSVISFRITLKNGEVRYFKSVSKLTDFHDKSVFIGINSDITEQYISNIALEERNIELEQSNAELASFNHVASHDLQEPLRKIETFISRIVEKDETALSPASQEYFLRIQLSVKRMRNLINDLLLFSRASKTEKVFRKTDLNELLENAIQDLSSEIEKRKAVIKSATLPVLNVITFQMQQLFMNLIGNSLKYSKPGVDPLIVIECTIVTAEEEAILNSKGEKKYYKISVSDNGQGFEQEYSETIFMLFYRLHPKSVSPGSGIGLSICKKIVENHGGLIRANSRPGDGATFSFFLPVE